jgi:hypothetical protein
MNTKTKTAHAQIKEHVKAVRAENAKAHADRMEACTAAAEGTVLMDGSTTPEVKVTKIPMGVSGKPKAKRLMLTSRAKMGKARPAAKAKAAPAPAKKSSKAQVAATKRAKAVAEGKGRDWSALRSVTPEKAEQYTGMLLAGTTARRAEQETGLTARQRVAVERVLSRAGYKFHRELNTGYDKSDAMQRFLYRMEAPAAS